MLPGRESPGVFGRMLKENGQLLGQVAGGSSFEELGTTKQAELSLAKNAARGFVASEWDRTCFRLAFASSFAESFFCQERNVRKSVSKTQ